MRVRNLLNVAAKGGAAVSASVAAQLVIKFVTQAILARILAPGIFGQLAIVITVAMFLNEFSNLRGDSYVIYQDGRPQPVLDVVYTMELIAAVALLALVLTTAPLLMSTLGKPELAVPAQVLAFSFLYNPLSRTRCLLERNLKFSRAKLPGVLSQFVAAALAVLLAYQGWGLWSLIVWRISALAFEVIILRTLVSYWPKLRWDSTIARQFAFFSWPLVGGAALSFVSYNADYLIVAQVVEDGTTQLGFYWLGFQAAAFLLLFRQILHSVLFPIFSRLTDVAFKTQLFLRLTRAVSGVFLVATIAAISFGRDMILAVYGANWEPAVLPFQIILIAVMMRAVSANLGSLFHSSGITKPDLVAGLLSTFLLVPAAYFATVAFGIAGTAMAVLGVQIITSVVIYERYTKPIASHGVLHFFFWPWLLSGLALLFALLAHSFELSFLPRLGVCAALIGITYAAVLRDVVQDVRKAIQSYG